MTQRMTRASFSVLLAAAALAQPLAVRAADPVKLKLAFFADDTEMTWVTVIKPFVDNVNRDAKGTIEIDPFLNGALGRALGETMAVTFVIGNADRISTTLFGSGNTIASIVALEFPESPQGSLKLASLLALGFLLFVISFIVLAISRMLLRPKVGG